MILQMFLIYYLTNYIVNLVSCIGCWCCLSRVFLGIPMVVVYRMNEMFNDTPAPKLFWLLGVTQRYAYERYDEKSHNTM